MDASPLIPAAYDLIWSGFALVHLVLLGIALFFLARYRSSMSGGVALVIALAIIVVPILGSTTWLAAVAFERRAAKRR